MKPALLIPFALAITLAACVKDNGSSATPTAVSDYEEELSLSYGAHPQQTFDVYLPQGRSADSTPVVILIHGGGWFEGDKADFGALNIYGPLTRNGYAVVNMNYRLVTDQANKHPTQLADIDSALAFIARKRADWRIDADRLALLGYSAGSHLALLYAYTRNAGGHVKAVVDFYGPTDFTHTSIKDQLLAFTVAGYLGAFHDQNPELWRSASPARQTARAVPTIIFQGGADYIVPPVQSTLLRDSLAAHGVAHEYVYYPQEGHGWSGAELEDSKAKTMEFLDAHLR